jgi:putative membrane protein
MKSFPVETKEAVGNRTVVAWSILLSTLVIGFLLWLIYFKETPGESLNASVQVLPALNATLNALSACSLVAGFLSIRKGLVNTHRNFMFGALLFSALFLVSYILYHSAHGDTAFRGTGFVRPVYFFILITHILLTAVALPMILTTVFFALTGRFTSHRRLARVTFPAWLYISVTGVAIFFMLRAFS